MIRRPPSSTRTDTLFPYTTLFRSQLLDEKWLRVLEAAFQKNLDNPSPWAGEYQRRGGRFFTDNSNFSVIQEMQDALYDRSEEHTSELQSLMRISYAVFCLKKKKITKNKREHDTRIKCLHTTHITSTTDY